MSEEQPREVIYTDPEGKERTGWYLNGHVYQDEAATVPIAVGSTFRTVKGVTYRMTPYGGIKWGQLGPTDENDNWVPVGSHWFRTAQDLTEQLKNRPAFSYDPQKDPFYQGARSQYLRQGRRAMSDAMGRAAGLTGGYGSSYAQAVGQQAYQSSLAELAGLLPGLYDRAWKAWEGENDALIRTINEAVGLYDAEYQAYLDRKAGARADREADRKDAQTAIDRQEADRKDREQALDSAHWDADFAEDLRRWELEFAQRQREWEDKQQSSQSSAEASEAKTERSYAYRMAMLALQQGLPVSDALLDAAGIDKAYAETIRRYFAALRAGN